MASEQSAWPKDPTIIGRYLDESGGFSEPRPPVLIVSGEAFTPVFLNAEKLTFDEGVNAILTEHNEDGGGIIEYALRTRECKEKYAEVIDILTEKVRQLAAENAGSRPLAISGGMRRDLLFSGPIAYNLRVPHITLYKQKMGRPDLDRAPEYVLFEHDSPAIRANTDNIPSGRYVIHVVDLLTKGSSVIDTDPKDGRLMGWAPQVWKTGNTLEHVVAVVDREEGSKERFSTMPPGGRSLRAHAAVAASTSYFEEHAQWKEEAIAYKRDPRGWTENFLDVHGIGVVVPYFQAGNQKKLDRGIKFLKHYKDFLERTGLRKKLEQAVRLEYNKPLAEIIARGSEASPREGATPHPARSASALFRATRRPDADNPSTARLSTRPAGIL